MSTSSKQTKPEGAPRGKDAEAARPMIEIRDLLGAAREAILVHHGAHYRLRVTANDKLILTK